MRGERCRLCAARSGEQVHLHRRWSELQFPRRRRRFNLLRPTGAWWRNRIHRGFPLLQTRELCIAECISESIQSVNHNPVRRTGPTHVRLAVFDLLGREVALLVDGQRNQGRYSVTFDASELKSGMYLYRLETPAFRQTKRFVLLK